MQAAVCDGRLRVARDYPVPIPQSDEALIRVSLAGVCGTDLEILRGYADFRGVLGHEFVGVVEECADPRWVGKRVVGEINVTCHRCPRCFNGLRKHCLQRQVLGIRGKDGAFAEYVTLPVINLHAVPNNLKDEEAVFTEPLAAAFDVLERVKINPSDRVFVLGDGRLGFLVAQVIMLRECEVTLLGRNPSKLARAKHLRIPAALVSEVEHLKADVVVDCTGAAEGFAQALSLLRPQGTLVVKSTYHGEPPKLPAQIVVDEITVVGSRCGPFPPALQALSEGKVEVARLVEATYPLSDIEQAMEHAGRRGALKVLVRP